MVSRKSKCFYPQEDAHEEIVPALLAFLQGVEANSGSKGGVSFFHGKEKYLIGNNTALER